MNTIPRQPHTGEKCRTAVLLKCPLCGQTVRMHGNPKDHYPPCPNCREGVFYTVINLAELVDEKSIKLPSKKELAIAANND